MTQKPLNGTKTHAMKPATLRILEELKKGPIPTAELNPGVMDRLSREDVIEYVSLPSPYKKDKGGLTTHIRYKEPT